MSHTQKNVYIALLAAQATVISVVEGMLPQLFAFAPGAKLGLANIITMLALFTLSERDSFKVVTMKLLLSTLIGGTFSTFLYSFVGSYLSFFGMALIRRLGPDKVSFIGISATGGILFNIGQLIAASIIANSATVMLYLPVLSLTGILAGILVGIVGNFMIKNVASIKRMQSEEAKRSEISRKWYEATLNR